MVGMDVKKIGCLHEWEKKLDGWHGCDKEFGCLEWMLQLSWMIGMDATTKVDCGMDVTSNLDGWNECDNESRLWDGCDK